MLNVKELFVNYGNVKAVNGVSLKVTQGEIVTIIGSNGAGKSTILGTIIGLVKLQSGEILFSTGDSEIDLGKLPAHKIAGLGISLVPEGRQILGKMTVKENLEIGAYLRK